MRWAIHAALGLTLLYGPAAQAAPPDAENPAARIDREPLEPGPGAVEAAPARSRFQTVPGDPIGLKSTVLDNGLTVWLSENHQTPEIFGAVVVAAGGKNDPASATGIAHYLEHMLFKGTQELGTRDYEAERVHLERLEALYEQLHDTTDESQRQRLRDEIRVAASAAAKLAIPNEVEGVLAAIGSSDINAYTSYDATVYHDAFPPHQIDAWLEIYAHRFEDPVFRLFPSEIEAVYEEKNIAMDGLFDPLAEAWLSFFFPQHPYGTQTILGSVEHLKQPSMKRMREFYERWYTPGNMALVLSGDFDAEEVLPRIEATFGTWKARESASPPAAPAAHPSGRRSGTIRMTPVRAAGVGWRTPPPDDPERAAIDLGARLLSDDQGSGWIDQLAQDGDVLFAQSVPFDFSDAGMQVVVVVPKIFGQTFKRAEALVVDQVERLRRGDFTDAELDSVRENLRKELALEFETNEGRVVALADVFAGRREWATRVEHLRRLDEVTKADVVRAAGQWFGGDYSVLRSRMGFPKKPKLDKPDNDPVPSTKEHSTGWDRLRSIPAREASPKLVDFDRDLARVEPREGLRVVTHENPANGIYSLQLRWGIGRHQLRPLWVLGDYLGRVGTKTHPGQAFRRKLFEIATTMDVWATEEEFVIALTGPEAHMPAALALVDELMRDPKPDPRKIRQMRREQNATRRVLMREPSQVADALANYALYGDASAYLRGYGRRSLRALSEADLLDAWSEVQAHALEARYVGRADANAVAGELLSQLELPASPLPATPKVVLPRRTIEEDTLFMLTDRGAIQTHLWAAVRGESVSPQERPRMELFNELYAGESTGVVYQEIREFRGLAYTAFGYFQLARLAGQPGYFWAYVGCNADKTNEVVDVLRGLMDAVPERSSVVPELKAALVDSAVGAGPSFRQVPSQVALWTDLGYHADPRTITLPAYPTLSFEDIRGFHKEHVQGRPKLLALLGDPRRFDEAALVEGKTIKVRKRRLFAR